MAARQKTKAIQPARSNNEIRTIMLQYFYDRNKAATSARGKKGQDLADLEYLRRDGDVSV